MMFTIQTRGITATNAIREYAEEKFLSLDKFFDGIIRADVIVGMSTHHHQKGEVFFAEVTLELPKRQSLHIEKTAEDIYKAIDQVKDLCKIDLEKMKEKLRARDAEVIREYKAYHLEEV